MKAVSLHQPWASLVALGLKRVETRSWSTRYRGWIAVHAAKRWTKSQRDATLRIFDWPEGNLRWPARWDNVPFGAVVAVARLADCVEMTPELIEAQSARERAFGDWTPGRWAWLLEDVRRLRDPVPLVGRQGLFTVPDALGWSLSTPVAP